ncbi:MAG TPA: tetratricopeptide repeat protein [bacterium]|nr:tetratricopeptide repeat protein [bacterium]
MANTNPGRFLLKGKKNDTEIQQFEDLIKKRPDDDRAYVRLAELYARAGNEDKAIELYEKAAILFEKKGFLNKAKAVLKQALMINSEHGKINVLLADYDRQSGLIKDATMRYQTAVNYYAKIGNKLAAINILRKMIEMFPGNINFSIKLGNMLVAEKMYHEAEKLLLPVAESLKGTDKVNEYAGVLKLLYTATNSESAIGRDLVNLYLKSGSYSNALAVLQKLIVDTPDSIEFLEKLAFVFEKLGETKKLISTYKQIAVACAQRQDIPERDRIYRKILDIDPNDREALSLLKEEGKLRDLISDKIDSSMMNMGEDDEHIDLVLDIDIETGETENEKDEHQVTETEESAPVIDIETAIKEAGVFLSYRLFNKAIDKIQSCKEWQTSPEAIDVLIQANIESGEIETAGDLIMSLIDLKISTGAYQEAKELLVDAENIVGTDDPRISKRQGLIVEHMRDLDSDIQNNDIFDGIPDLPQKETVSAVSENEDEDELVELLEPEDHSEPFELTNVADEQSGTEKSEFENMTMDILSELQEPPQVQLDELEFYISIEDFASATQLLQELLINYPDSRFLSGIKDILPVRKEDNLSDTMKEMKNVLENSSEDGGGTEDLYDMALSHLSMGMFSEAITLFNKILSADGENIACLTGLAQAYMMADKPDQAVKVLKEAEKLTEDDEILSSIKEQIDELENSKKSRSKR